MQRLVYNNNNKNILGTQGQPVNISICLHPRGEWLSDRIRRDGLWAECADLLSLWWSPLASHESHMLLDIGANIGICSFAILASDPLAKVVMFEPVAHNQVQIARSICQNPHWASRVALFLGALSAETGLSPMVGTFKSLGVSRLGSPDSWAAGAKGNTFIDFGEVQTQRLDDILKGAGHARLTKIDIEGGEYRALSGAQQLLQDAALPLIYFEYNPQLMAGHGSQPQQLLRLLQNWAYDIFWCAADFVEQKHTSCGLFDHSVPLGDLDFSVLLHCGGLRLHENFVAFRNWSRPAVAQSQILDRCADECFLPKFLTHEMCCKLRHSAGRFSYHPTWYNTCCLHAQTLCEGILE
ncbi:unnamed protein product [Polarella glacialis]|uniref:Methyltransferase FkbM domain-containing protein n=2 Tax=Polarella glacialis TaxID=89957 RepID=A0A813HYL3_POLGL|nr:unnamed protein product [Polarella glacialis]